MTGISARWTAPQLMTALAAAGWGSLDRAEWQGVRSVLHGLVARLPHKSAQGLTTAEQIAAAAGLSERWTRRCLVVLEDIGVIEWRRGGVVDGRPQPSFIRIAKRRLVELVEEARPERARAIAARRALTAARLAGLRKTIVKPRPLKSHAELSCNPVPPSVDGLTPEPSKEEGNTMLRRPGPIQYDPARLPVTCKHGGLSPDRCPSCKLAARTPAQIAEDDAYAMDVNPSLGREPSSPDTIARGIALMKAALSRADA